MIFKFKKSKITVDCFTYSPAAYELYKIRSAKVYYPEHIKKLEAGIEMRDPATNVPISMPTIKRCVAITDLYKKGFIIPFWMDFVCNPIEHVQQRSELGATDPRHEHNIIRHLPSQYPGILDNYLHIKFRGAWNFVEKTGVDFLWNPAAWNINNDVEKFVIPPGIINFKDQYETNLNMFFHKNAERFTLSAGTPLVHLIPLSEKDVEIKCHQISFQDWSAMVPYPVDVPTISDGTKINRLHKDKKRAEELDNLETKGKCPFGFKK
jgi:hypothetical protein